MRERHTGAAEEGRRRRPRRTRRNRRKRRRRRRRRQMECTYSWIKVEKVCIFFIVTGVLHERFDDLSDRKSLPRRQKVFHSLHRHEKKDEEEQRRGRRKEKKEAPQREKKKRAEKRVYACVLLRHAVTLRLAVVVFCMEKSLVLSSRMIMRNGKRKNERRKATDKRR